MQTVAPYRTLMPFFIKKEPGSLTGKMYPTHD